MFSCRRYYASLIGIVFIYFTKMMKNDILYLSNHGVTSAPGDDEYSIVNNVVLGAYII